ncbi:hypothetical protein S245_033190, partial [Arachis hypogaea]
WIPILFKPPAYMDLDDLDIKMATYVFAPNKRSDEYLVTTNKFSGTRDNFKSLIPKERGTWGCVRFGGYYANHAGERNRMSNTLVFASCVF